MIYDIYIYIYILRIRKATRLGPLGPVCDRERRRLRGSTGDGQLSRAPSAKPQSEGA